MAKLGSTAFVVGVLLAIVAGLLPQLQTSDWLSWVFVALGLLVGFLNVTAKETTEFLTAAIALLVVGAAGSLPSFGPIVLSILSNIVAFVAPAALVVALKAMWELAKD